jgi:hypothetical protein
MIKKPKNSALQMFINPTDIMFTCNLIETLEKEVNVLEVGVYLGGWSITIDTNLKRKFNFVGIDPYPFGSGEKIRQSMLKNIGDNNLHERFTLVNCWAGLKGLGKFEIIHVDGEHTEDAVTTDLKEASNVLTDDGVIIVDDYIHPYFPGIASAIYDFISKTQFVAFASSGNKIYLCKAKFYDEWRNRVNKTCANVGLVCEEFYGQFDGDTAEYTQNTNVSGKSVLLLVHWKNRYIAGGFTLGYYLRKILRKLKVI